jgi:predicted DNA-binding transcriptional regulator AlpA
LIDGDQRLYKVKSSVGTWLDYLASTGISCHHRDYDPTSPTASEMVLGFINDFPVKYSKTVEEMLDSARFLTTKEVAAILSEHWSAVRERDVRRLTGLPRERRGQRSLGFRESEVAKFIKSNT